MIFKALIALVCVWSSSAIVPSHVLLVDWMTFTPKDGPQTFLFRTGYLHNQTNASYFDYDYLVTLMSQRASEKNLTLPKDLYLVDITLDNNITDAADERLEHTFFNTHPELGEVIDWPIIGNPFNPVNMSLSTVIADLPTYEKSGSRIECRCCAPCCRHHPPNDLRRLLSCTATVAVTAPGRSLGPMRWSI